MSEFQDQQIETAIALAMVQMKRFLEQTPERIALDSAIRFEKYCHYFMNAIRQFLCLTFMTHERSIIYLSFCSHSVSIDAHAARMSIMNAYNIPLNQLQLEYASVISFGISNEELIRLLRRAPFSILEKTVHDFSLNRTEKRKLLYYAGKCDIDHIEFNHHILVYLSRSPYHIEEYTAIQKITALEIRWPIDFLTQRHHSFKFFSWMAAQLDMLTSQGVTINADIIDLLTTQREDGSVLFTRINAFVLLILNCQENAIPITDILYPLFHFTLKRAQDEKNREALNNQMFPRILEAHQRNQLNEQVVRSLMQNFVIGTSSIRMSSTTLTVFSHKNSPSQTNNERVDFSAQNLSTSHSIINP